MKRARRVLIVTPVFTHPPNQGNAARILAFGRELKARGIIVDVFHYCLDFVTAEGDAAMRREWNAVYSMGARAHASQRYPGWWGLDDWCPDEVCEAVSRLCREVGYDAVVTNYVWMSRCLLGVEGSLRIIDTHDLFGDRHRISLENGLEPNWFFTSRVQESLGFDRADLVIGIQAGETAEIAQRTKVRAVTIGHPMSAWFLTHPDSTVKASAFGYFGSANPWNVRSVKAFDEALARAEQDCDWAIAGTICEAPLELRTNPFRFGRVSAPEDFYRHVDCCINPMSGGTGLKIKTVEAMAYGRPVIGSRDAFAGLGASHWLHDLATVDDLALAVGEYAASESLRAELLIATRRLFARYSASTRQQFDLLAAIIAKQA
ncbi:MAG: glycosyltransferase [Rhizobiales bacterium]|nr:glycosyltransferase [Hyphomicrobiales bacterium]